MDKIDTFGVLPEAEYEMAKMLYQTGVSLNCKMLCKTRALRNQPKGFRIIFNRREANSVLFWMQITDGSLYVKANLFHIQNYAEKMTACSDTIKKAITATQECGFCGLCPPRAPYIVDNVIYNPCVFHGHYFTRMEIEDWHTLSDLLVAEHDNQCGPESAILRDPESAIQRDPESAPSAIPNKNQRQVRPYHGFNKN
jgi:hypothetical protein